MYDQLCPDVRLVSSICGSLLHFTAQFSTISIVYHISNGFFLFFSLYVRTPYYIFPPRRRLASISFSFCCHIFMCTGYMHIFGLSVLFYFFQIFNTTLFFIDILFHLCTINSAFSFESKCPWCRRSLTFVLFGLFDYYMY